MNQWEREEDQLTDDVNAGRITQAEYNRLMREMARDQQEEARAAAEDAAERAYNDVMGGW